MKIIFDDGTELKIKEIQKTNITKDDIVTIGFYENLDSDNYEHYKKLLDNFFSPAKVLIYECRNINIDIFNKNNMKVSKWTSNKDIIDG